jgi:hypothetical protein
VMAVQTRNWGKIATAEEARYEYIKQVTDMDSEPSTTDSRPPCSVLKKVNSRVADQGTVEAQSSHVLQHYCNQY